MSNSTKTKNEAIIGPKFFKNIGAFFKCYKLGLCSDLMKSKWFWASTLSWAVMSYNLFYFDHYIITRALHYLEITGWVSRVILHVSEHVYFSLSMALWSLHIFFEGVSVRKSIKRAQEEMDSSGISDGPKRRPEVIGIFEKNPYKTLLLDASGVSTVHFQNKRAELEKAFGLQVLKIKDGKNPKYTEVVFTKDRTPELAPFDEYIQKDTLKPFEFPVGVRNGDLIKQNIRELPHLLIAGSTDGGKSTFWKNILLGLLQNPENLRVAIIDLKNGVEAKSFEDVPGIEIHKERQSAVNFLTKLRSEMHDRFTFMESKGVNSIDPIRDKKEIIVCFIDEASILFRIRGVTDKFERAQIEEARKIMDDLAKLSRAAGIHLVLATQKVTKDAIDTRVQDNLSAQLCYRMQTLQGSLTVLGNGKAKDLPETKGRAIWRSGTNQKEVQTLYLETEVLKEHLEDVKCNPKLIDHKPLEDTEPQKNKKDMPVEKGEGDSPQETQARTSTD